MDKKKKRRKSNLSGQPLTRIESAALSAAASYIFSMLLGIKVKREDAQDPQVTEDISYEEVKPGTEQKKIDYK